MRSVPPSVFSSPPTKSLVSRLSVRLNTTTITSSITISSSLNTVYNYTPYTATEQQYSLLHYGLYLYIDCTCTCTRTLYMYICIYRNYQERERQLASSQMDVKDKQISCFVLFCFSLLGLYGRNVLVSFSCRFLRVNWRSIGLPVKKSLSVDWPSKQQLLPCGTTCLVCCLLLGQWTERKINSFKPVSLNRWFDRFDCSADIKRWTYSTVLQSIWTRHISLTIFPLICQTIETGYTVRYCILYSRLNNRKVRRKSKKMIFLNEIKWNKTARFWLNIVSSDDKSFEANPSQSKSIQAKSYCIFLSQ